MYQFNMFYFKQSLFKSPRKDVGNLSADHTQIKITAKLLDPKLSGTCLNSVNSPLTGKEGRVTAVVAKAR